MSTPLLNSAVSSNHTRRHIRVLTLIDRPYGGAEQLARSVATRLDPERFKSTLCVSRWQPTTPLEPKAEEMLAQLAASNVGFLGLGRRHKRDVWVWGRLVRFLRQQRIDVLHAHKFGSNVWGTLLGRAAGVPVVLAHEHTWSYEGQPLRQALDRHLIARGADRLIAVSREDQRRMIEIEGIPPARTLFIPIGVPQTEPRRDRDVRAELGIEPGTPVIGAVGMLRAQKAFHVLLHATAMLVSARPDIQVLIAGDGPERDALHELARELGVDRSVRLLGRRSDVPDVLRALDIAVLCSDFEGSPAAVIEYMGAGLPVVATSVGGVPDLIEPGKHGLLVPPGDPAALADAISELLADPASGRAMGARGRERRIAEFDIEMLVHRLEDLYGELLAKRGVQLLTSG